MQNFNSFQDLQASQTAGCLSDMTVFNEKIRQPATNLDAGDNMKDINEWLYEFSSWKPSTPEEALDAVTKIDDSLRGVKRFAETVTIVLNNLRRTMDKIAKDGGAVKKEYSYPFIDKALSEWES